MVNDIHASYVADTEGLNKILSGLTYGHVSEWNKVRSELDTITEIKAGNNKFERKDSKDYITVFENKVIHTKSHVEQKELSIRLGRRAKQFRMVNYKFRSQDYARILISMPYEMYYKGKKKLYKPYPLYGIHVVKDGRKPDILQKILQESANEVVAEDLHPVNLLQKYYADKQQPKVEEIKDEIKECKKEMPPIIPVDTGKYKALKHRFKDRIPFPGDMARSAYNLEGHSSPEELLKSQMLVTAAIRKKGHAFTEDDMCEMITGDRSDTQTFLLIKELVRRGIFGKENNKDARVPMFMLKSLPSDMTENMYWETSEKLLETRKKLRSKERYQKGMIRYFGENTFDVFQYFPSYPSDIPEAPPVSKNGGFTLRNQIMAAAMSYHAVDEKFRLSHISQLITGRQDSNILGIAGGLVLDGYLKQIGDVVRKKNLYVINKKPSDITEESYYKMIRTFPVIAGRWGNQIDDILYQRQTGSEMQYNITLTQ